MDEVLEVIESYNDYLKKIPSGILYIAECLREEKFQDAFKTIKDFSEGVMWLITVSDLLGKNNVEVNLNVDQIKSFLVEINDGLEGQDYLLVADLFEFEIAPFFEDVPLIENVS